MSGSFLDDIAIGRKVEGDSPLHRARPLGKAVLFTLVATATFYFQSATSFLILGLLLCVLSELSRVSRRLFWRSLRPVYVLALFTILAGAFVNHPGASTLHPSFAWNGLHLGGLYAARLVLITLLTTLFFLTTRPNEAVALGITLLKPLRLLGIDQHELSLLVHLAYRFVPLLRREIEEVSLGRKARNLPPSGNPFRRFKEGADTLIFLFVGALKRAESTSYALEDRGVLDSWNQKSVARDRRGLGGWMTPALLLVTSLLLWKDSGLL